MSLPEPREATQVGEFPVFSLPSRRTSAWVVETDPDEVRAWLASVTQSDAVEAAQQIYRALYTLNRMTLPDAERLVLMELYREPVMLVVSRLQSHFMRLALPLKPRFKQLADFLSQLQMEMAHGYKHLLEALRAEERPWESDVFLFATERSIRHLGQVLLRAYQVYMPAPAGVWSEIHGLYRYAARYQRHQDGVETGPEQDHTIERTYLQVLMLGLCGPYQLPMNECQRVDAFLARWSHKAGILENLEGIDPVGHFLLDLDADHPAVPYPRDIMLHSAPHLRAVNAIELARVVHEILSRLRQGEAPSRLNLGFECIGASCGDTLRRMLRFWGLAGRRQFLRRHVRRSLSLCVGINAIHFFASGQQPFTTIRRQVSAGEGKALLAGRQDPESVLRTVPDAVPVPAEYYRIDSQWQVRDESAGGFSLLRQGNAGLAVRIGDLLGIPDNGNRQWRVAVVRWIKSRDSQHIEAGIEMIAPSAHPVAIQGEMANATICQALMLPPVEALHQPPTLVVPPHVALPGKSIEILDDETPARRVRILKVVERTNAFAQVVFADEAR